MYSGSVSLAHSNKAPQIVPIRAHGPVPVRMVTRTRPFVAEEGERWEVACTLDHDHDKRAQ